MTTIEPTEAQPKDFRLCAYSAEAKVRLIFVRSTESAKTLERNHLCGPVAGAIQAQAMTATAIIAGELSQVGERVTLRIDFPQGMMQGLMIECSHEGALRGYTRIKVMNELDDSDTKLSTKEINVAALGRKAVCTVIRTAADGASSHASFSVEMNDMVMMGDILEAYYSQAVQRRAVAQLSSTTKDGYLSRASGVMFEVLPDATDEQIEKLQAFFDDGTIARLLKKEAGAEEIAETLGLTDLVYETAQPLCFACTCSQARVLGMISSLPLEDLKALQEKPEGTEIFCHMCGKNFVVPAAIIAELAAKREATKSSDDEA